MEIEKLEQLKQIISDDTFGILHFDKFEIGDKLALSEIVKHHSQINLIYQTIIVLDINAKYNQKYGLYLIEEENGTDFKRIWGLDNLNSIACLVARI